MHAHAPATCPLARTLSAALQVLQSLHESKKVTFKMQAVVTKYNESASKKGCVGSVTLQVRGRGKGGMDGCAEAGRSAA